jgi:hypothetical protein
MNRRAFFRVVLAGGAVVVMLAKTKPAAAAVGSYGGTAYGETCYVFREVVRIHFPFMPH